MIDNRVTMLIALLVSITLFSSAQTQPLGHIAFYNVENLFDIQDDPEINDEDFTPGGRNEWDTVRYLKKLDNVARVFAGMAGPDVIGLSEVENRKVLEDLVQHSMLKRYKYQIIHFDSPDKRGIDVALLYKTGRFLPFYSKNIAFEDEEEFYTRDILHVKGLYLGDTLNVFVNHWPSRRGGKEGKRILAAQLLRRTVDELQTKNPDAKIIIMGDLNDDPSNKSVRKYLLADNNLKKLGTNGLYNTSTYIFKQGYGTLFYRGTWNLFDQIIISQSMLEGRSATYIYRPESFKVFAPEWMRVPKGENAGAPYRTFVSGKYQEGFSDHYPVFIEISK